MNGGGAGDVSGAGASSGSWAARAAASGSQDLPMRSEAAPRAATINQLVTFLPTSQGVEVPSPGVTTSSVSSFDTEFPPLPGRCTVQRTVERRRSLSTLAPALGIRSAAALVGGALVESEPLGVAAAQVAGVSRTLVRQVPLSGRPAPAGTSGRTPPVTGAGSAYAALSDGASSTQTRPPLPATPPPRRPAALHEERPRDGHLVEHCGVPMA